MFGNVYVRRNIPAVSLHSSYEALSSENVSVGGRIVSHSVYVVDDSSHRYDGVCVEDFYFENLLSAGTDLKEMFMSDSAFVAMANVEAAINMFNSRFNNSEKSSNYGKN